MRLALPQWQDRISPVLDVAGSLLVVDLEQGRPVHRAYLDLHEEGVLDRARRIGQLGIEVLICGALSRPLELALDAAGIRLIAQTCGEVDEVIEAFASGRLRQRRFRMPGCCGCRRRLRRGQSGGGMT